MKRKYYIIILLGVLIFLLLATACTRSKNPNPVTIPTQSRSEPLFTATPTTGYFRKPEGTPISIFSEDDIPSNPTSTPQPTSSPTLVSSVELVITFNIKEGIPCNITLDEDTWNKEAITLFAGDRVWYLNQDDVAPIPWNDGNGENVVHLVRTVDNYECWIRNEFQLPASYVDYIDFPDDGKKYALVGFNKEGGVFLHEGLNENWDNPITFLPRGSVVEVLSNEVAPSEWLGTVDVYKVSDGKIEGFVRAPKLLLLN